MLHKFIFLFSLLYGVPYPDFIVHINENPSPQDIFIHSADGHVQHMAILDSSLNIKWNIVSTSGKGWDFKVNNNNKLTYGLCELRNMVSIAYLITKQSQEISQNQGVFYNHDYA